MSGIVVGVDGSGHSQRALAWAMHEAAIRHAPLTVLTVYEAIRGYYSTMVTYPDDSDRTEELRTMVQLETDKVLAALDGPHLDSGRGAFGHRLRWSLAGHLGYVLAPQPRGRSGRVERHLRAGPQVTCQ
jgi:nucleotide-binding universal stress UspA family protein